MSSPTCTNAGAGAAIKVVVNSTLGAAMVAFGEALALGDTLGLDRAVLLDLLADSATGSTGFCCVGREVVRALTLRP